MAKFTNPLDHVKIAAPCSADWNQMFSFEGERVRFCSQCNLNVYNLSAMTRSEAETLLTSTEGRLCVRFYRRSDGTILSQNCPVGLTAIKRRVAWAGQVILGMVVGLLSGMGFDRLITKLDLLDIESSKPSRAERHSVYVGMIAPHSERPMKPAVEPGMKTVRTEQGRIISPKGE